MIIRTFFGRALIGAALLTTSLATPHPLAAQPNATPANNARANAAHDLSLHLNTLSSDAHNLRALIGAGEAALELGDPNAAIGFFGRADEIDPRNGKVKAGIGRALLQLEQPRDALRHFDSAVDLGVAEADIAMDRGLAYDLRGDQRRAQRDYAIAARRGVSDELIRRQALSLGISKQVDQAMALLDPLLRKQDKAAWRARAFILAMNGDVAGASGIVRTVMPAYLAAPMEPFLGRLAGLSDAQKALAVHFGQMPSDGKTQPVIDRPVAPRIASTGLTPVSPDPGPKSATAPAATPQTPAQTARRRPGQSATQAIIAAQTAPTTNPPVAAPVKTADATPQPSRLASIVSGLQLETPTVVAPPVPRLTANLPRSTDATVTAPKTPEVKKAEPARPEPKKPDPKKAEPKKPEPKKPDPKLQHPERQWVQIATGADRAALARDFDKMVKKSPDVFKGVQAWTVPFNRTRRMLAGPFATPQKAREFVSRLTKAGHSGFVWVSPAGYEVEKLSAK